MFYKLFFSLFLLLLLTACGRAERIDGTAQIRGRTMGTSYSVIIPDLPLDLDQVTLEVRIESLLKELNQKLSTYISDSDISRFNQSRSTAWISLPKELVSIVDKANAISLKTGGAYDVTIGPVVNLWGFGNPEKTASDIPDGEELQKALASVGFDQLELRTSPPAIRKKNSILTLDLSSIAKGFAVDKIGEMLERSGVRNYLAEIGGELRTRGMSTRGDAWRIGIEQPDASEPSVLQAMRLEDSHIATSGDYRNYFEIDGIRYSHAIDARTGKPVDHKLSSVTVLHNTTTEADGWATALMLLGEKQGFQSARENRIAAFFVIRSEGGYVIKYTDSFAKILE